MPSYAVLLIPLVVLAILWTLGRLAAKKSPGSWRGWMTAALLVGLALAVATAVRPAPSLSAAEPPAAAEPGAKGEQGPQPTEAAAPEGEAQSKPAAKEADAQAESKQPAGKGGEQAEGEQQERQQAENEGAEGPPAGPLIKSWWQRSVFNLTLLALLAAVLVGPFYLAAIWTKNWRQPLWAWPIGAALLCGAVVGVVAFLRWLFGFFPQQFANQFEAYVSGLAALWKLWTFVALVAVPMWLGAYLSRRWRMPDYAGRIGIIAFCVLAGLVVTILGWPPKLGIDLKGGVILVYELEGQPGAAGPEKVAPEEARQPAAEGEQAAEEAAAAAGPGKVDMDKLVQAVRLRADPSNIRELTIRPRGERQIEVIVPEADEEELARIKRKISSAGTLEFRILANRRDHGPTIERALASDKNKLYDPQGNLQAWWVPVKRGEEEHMLQFAQAAETVYRKATYRGYEWTEFLVIKDPFDVTGGYLVHAEPGIDQSGRPNVLFTFNHQGGLLFGGLTGSNRPDEAQDFSRHLGIILDGYLQSAPAIKSTIFERGEITGDFTRREVQDLVDILNAGSLPTTLSENPISEMYMGPGLGQDTIARARLAIVLSVLLVFVFMLVYYRFCGLVACLTLLMDLVLILAVMIAIKAAFTLPGMAGLALTLGMAVDANVLIYERMREELAKQATLRMAIRNGFDRALSAIIDSNVTTLITATVLYVIGTDQIKGFAVTLWLGIVVSMFTAVYCGRVIFDVAEKQKWITRVTMLRMLTTTRIDFLGMQRLMIGGSVLLILIGLGAVVARGAGLLDIDFTGGVSVLAVFDQPQDIANIREKLGTRGEGLQDLSVTNVRSLNEQEAGRRFVINTSGPRELPPGTPPEKVLAAVEEHIRNAFGPQLTHYSMSFTILPGEPSPPGNGSGESGGENANSQQPAGPQAATESPAVRTRAEVQFQNKLGYESLAEQFKNQIAKKQKAGLLPAGAVEFELYVNDQFKTVDHEAVSDTWFVQLALPQDKAQAVLQAVKAEVESQPVFPQSNTIGGQVASGMRVDAVMAVLASLVFITAYLWIRFQRVAYGVAAVVALIHDVLFTLGAVAVSTYLAPVLGFLLIGDFKIGLTALAAFLTVIGYSLNDTIVVFDRIREVRGKAPRLTPEMVNLSINQTLSRTVLTGLTTIAVIVVLYIGGGPELHVFAYTMLVGILVGTYSSVFIASPCLVWMVSGPQPREKSKLAPKAA